MDIQQILKFLPHRYPFLLVDRVLELAPGASIKAVKNVTYNEAFFQGHFPDIKVMPGVLIIEAIAQAGGILLFHSIPDASSKLVLLSKVDKAKFRRTVVPGDQLRLEAEIVKLKSRFCHLRGRALVEGEVAVEGEIMAFVVDAEELYGGK
jgi:3-hydroxyacyl-[acyl-carrier-protein] dehydratase/UDP-3-O-[3-hydroxymyristoyl] N-acetylglucosamine deacetylase/3-hydroxyacyl-[acyl-carrier-protein] dehydratase